MLLTLINPSYVLTCFRHYPALFVWCTLVVCVIPFVHECTGSDSATTVLEAMSVLILYWLPIIIPLTQYMFHRIMWISKSTWLSTSHWTQQVCFSPSISLLLITNKPNIVKLPFDKENTDESLWNGVALGNTLAGWNMLYSGHALGYSDFSWEFTRSTKRLFLHTVRSLCGPLIASSAYSQIGLCVYVLKPVV